jgi:hypothetical protein
MQTAPEIVRAFVEELANPSRIGKFPSRKTALQTTAPHKYGDYTVRADYRSTFPWRCYYALGLKTGVRYAKGRAPARASGHTDSEFAKLPELLQRARYLNLTNSPIIAFRKHGRAKPREARPHHR